MKKLWVLFISFILFGCGNSSSEDNETTAQLQDLGLTEEQADHFFVYINSIYLGYIAFDDLSNSVKDKKYEISQEEYNTVMTPFNTAADMYNAFENSDKLIDFDDYLLDDLGPSGIMNNMEEHNRDMGYMEKALMVQTFNNYTEDIIKRIDVSDDHKESLYSIYEETVYVNNTFSAVNDDWKESLNK